MAKSKATSAKRRTHIPPPAPNKQPLKANVYEYARTNVAPLIPMFPYIDEGSIVPAVTLYWGQAEGDYGFFIHENTVEEIAIVFGGGGTTARGNAGLVRLNDHVHGVGRILKDTKDRDAYVLVTVTQRQAEGGKQREAIWFVCENCKTEIGRNEKDVPVPKPGRQHEHGRYVPFFTIQLGNETRQNFNASEEARTCPKCGHLNAPYPVERLGSHLYIGQTRVVEMARQSLDLAASESALANETA